MHARFSVILKSFLAGAVLFSLPVHIQADPFSFVTINNPADATLQTPVFNQLLGINDAGVIAGYYGDGMVVNNHGFTWSNGTFTSENVPGADQTQVVAINNTLSGGAYETGGFSVINATGVNTGFVKAGTPFTAVNGPSSTFTQVLGLNDNNQAVGFYTVSGVTSGLLYNLASAKVTTLVTPTSWNTTSVTAAGINNAGVIVGFYVPSGGGDVGFIDNHGTFTTPTDTLGTNPMFFGINNLGQIVGTDTASDGSSEGFVYNMNTGTFTKIVDPNEQTTPNGFMIAGTILNGINDEGQVVGFYAGPGGAVDGLLCNLTPEPASLGLISLASFLAIGARRGFRRSKT
jgi:hypothetical protein